jgi:hypothetical protein
MKSYGYNGIAGCVCQGAGLLGGRVGLYQAEQAGMGVTGGRWVVVCEDHRTSAAYEQKAQAEEHLFTADWCALCQQGIPVQSAGEESWAEGSWPARWWVGQGMLALKGGAGKPPILVSAARDHNPLIFQKPGSFINQFRATISPYSGCEMACRFCYVVDLLKGQAEKRGGWGNFVSVRFRAVEYLVAQRDRLAGAHLFMSATTDPYQRVEQRYRLTRSLLEALLDIPFAFLLISTRGGLLRRDLDLLTDSRFRGRVEVGISITSDRKEVHEALEPDTSSYEGRFALADEVRRRGIPVRIHAAPLADHTPTFFAKALQVANWCWVDGTGHGARREEPARSLLYDYDTAFREAREAAALAGAAGRIGYGSTAFGNRWDAEQGQVVSVAPQAETGTGPITVSGSARREQAHVASRSMHL